MTHYFMFVLNCYIVFDYIAVLQFIYLLLMVPLSHFHPHPAPSLSGCSGYSCNDQPCSYHCSCPHSVDVLLQGVLRNIFKILIHLPNFSKNSYSDLYSEEQGNIFFYPLITKIYTFFFTLQNLISKNDISVLICVSGQIE